MELNWGRSVISELINRYTFNSIFHFSIQKKKKRKNPDQSRAALHRLCIHIVRCDRWPYHCTTVNLFSPLSGLKIAFRNIQTLFRRNSNAGIALSLKEPKWKSKYLNGFCTRVIYIRALFFFSWKCSVC